MSFLFYEYKLNVPSINFFIDIKVYMAEMQNVVQTNTYHLTTMINNMLDQVARSQERIEPLMERLQKTSDLLWLVSISMGLTILCISLILSVGLLLGIIHEEGGAKITFIVGAVLIAIGSIGLVLFTIAILLAGSHGEVFLCRPLYGAPNFYVFGKLFDKPGWVYENETVNGIINDLLYANENDDVKPLNVTLATAIDQCEQNDATFSVFQFERIVNVPQILDVQEYDKLDEEIDKIFVSTATFTTLTETLQNILNYMFSNSDVNFSLYRVDLSRPTPEKDLSTFIDQMQRVSVQVYQSKAKLKFFIS